MIPKIIHYCWFGGGRLPEPVTKCMDSWKEMLPEYEIRRWDESCFDCNISNYVKEAYACGKWAFVSDYARFYILEKYGGIYFDTDLELIRPIDDILDGGNFLAAEKRYYPDKDSLFWNRKASCKGIGNAINPGLGIAVTAHNPLIKAILEQYDNDHFLRSDGSINDETIVDKLLPIFINKGYDPFLDEVQNVEGFNIFPTDYFGGINNETREEELTANTRAIHHYNASWASSLDKLVIAIHKVFKGKGKIVFFVGMVISSPLSIMARSKKDGFPGALKYYFRKVFLHKR